MEVRHAIRIIHAMIYLPGWSFEATDHTDRFQDAIQVKIHYRALNTNEERAAEGYQGGEEAELKTWAAKPLYVGDMTDELELQFALEEMIREIDDHKRREALREAGSLIAPFHPHRLQGTKNWIRFNPSYRMEDDLRFGTEG